MFPPHPDQTGRPFIIDVDLQITFRLLSVRNHDNLTLSTHLDRSRIHDSLVYVIQCWAIYR